MPPVHPIERRLYKRIRAGGLKGVIKYLSRGDVIPVELLDFGRGGAGVKLKRECIVPVGADLNLVVNEMAMEGTASSKASDDRGSIRMGIRFNELRDENVRSIALLENIIEESESIFDEPRHEEVTTIADDNAIRKILACYLFYRKERIYIHNAERRFLGSGRAADGGKFMVVRLDHFKGGKDDRVLYFTFNGYVSYYTFKERVLGIDDNRLTILSPLVLLKKRSRRFPRIGDVRLDAYLSSPLDGKTFVRGRVADIDFGGLAVEFDSRDCPFHAGSEIPKIVVKLPGCGEIQFSGMIKYARSAPMQPGTRCGIAITSFFRSCKDVWHRYIYNLLLPDLVEEGFNFNVREFCSILDTSGYISQHGRNIDFYEPILTSFADLYEQSVEVKGEKQFILHFGDRLMGVASKNRIYSRTFLLHHLGIDRGKKDLLMNKEQIAKQVLLGVFVDSYLTEDLIYCVIYFSAIKKWNRYMYDDFLDSVTDRSSYIYNLYNFLEFDVTSFNKKGDLFIHTDVKAAGGGILDAVSDFLKKKVPPIIFEAYDFAPERLDLSKYNRAAGGELSRERIIFYRQGFGEIYGVAIAESSLHTINLFNLDDSARVFVRDDLPEDEKREIKSSLLKKVICYFASRCKPYFNYFCNDGDVTYAEELGFKNIDRGRELIMERELLPSYIDFIEMTLSTAEYNKKIEAKK